MALTRIKLNQITQPLDQDLSVPSLNANGSITATGDIVTDAKLGAGIDTPLGNIHSKSTINNLLILESEDLNSDIIALDTGGSTRLRSASGLLQFWVGGDASSTGAANSTAALTINANTDITTANNLDIGGDLTVSGNFLVSGNTTTLNVDTLAIEDLNLTLANGAANNTVADGAGITIDGANATLTYVASSDSFSFNKPIIADGNALTNVDLIAVDTAGDLSVQTLKVNASSGDSVSIVSGDNITFDSAPETTKQDMTMRGTSKSVGANAVSIILVQTDYPSPNYSNNLTVGETYNILVNGYTVPRVFYGHLSSSDSTYTTSNIPLNGFYTKDHFSDPTYISVTIGWGEPNGTSSSSQNPTGWYGTGTWIYDGGDLKITASTVGFEVNVSSSPSFTGTVTADGLTVNGVAKSDYSVATNGLAAFESGAGIYTYSSGGVGVLASYSSGSTKGLLKLDSSDLQVADGSRKVLTTDNGDILFYNSAGDTVKFHWDAADERLGIGTTAPEAPVDIVASKTHAASVENLKVRNTAVGQPVAISLSAVADNGGQGNEGAIYFEAGASGVAPDNQIQFNADHQTDTNPDMVITGAGNVGIGETDPDTSLHIKKNQSSAASSIKLENSAGGNDSSFDIDWQLASSGTSARIRAIRTNDPGAGDTDLIFSTSDNGTSLTDRVIIKHNGNVGIGADDPIVSLHIGDGTTDEFIIIDKGASNTSGILFRNAGANKVKLQVNTEEELEIHTNNTLKAKFSETGTFYNYNNQPTIRPTLNLDFANSKELDPRITFYRDSIATYYDSKGAIRYANRNEPRFDHDPVTGESKGLLIEEERKNWFAYTDQISYSSYWTGYGLGTAVNNSVVVQGNYAVSPDGKANATRIKFDIGAGTTANDRMFWRKCNPGFTASTSTMSVWLKSTDGTDQIMGWHSNGGRLGSFTVTGEWQRFTSTINNSAGAACFGLELAGDMAGAADISDVLVWGFQIEEGAFATSYIPSDTRFTSRSSEATYYDENGTLRTAPRNTPRYGHKYDGRKWVETGLILENSATNLLSQSITFSNWQTYNYDAGIGGGTTVTLTQNATTAPDGSNTAIKFTPLVSSYAQYIWLGGTTNSEHAFSLYVKKAQHRYVHIGSGASPYAFDFDTGDWASGAGDPKLPVEKLNDGWYRISTKHTVGGGFLHYVWSSNTAQNGGYPLTALSVNGTDGVYIWGGQIEANSSPTSFIYSYGSNVTRSADVASTTAYTRAEDRIGIYEKSFNSGWYNQDESTWYTEFSTVDSINDGGYTTVIHVEDVDQSNRYGMFAHPNNYGNPEWYASTGAGTFDLYPTSNAYTTEGGTYRKAAGTYKLNDVAFAVDGDLIGTDTTVSPIINASKVAFGGRIMNELGGMTGHFKKIVYYPERLSNAELQALTEND